MRSVAGRWVWVRWACVGLAVILYLGVQGSVKPSVSMIVSGLGIFAAGPEAGTGSEATGSSTADLPPEDVVVPPPPYVQAQSAVLMDLESGTLLFAHKAFRPHAPGALAKVTAALTALRRGEPDDEVRVGAVVRTPGALRFDLTEGERFTLGDLLRMMLYRPEVDPAVAVATHIAGSIDAFARQMNAEARRVGATASRFGDPNGLDAGGSDGSVTTAYDLALIAKAALADPSFAHMVEAQRARITRRGQSRVLFNLNSFLSRRVDATGVKTAFSPDGGYSMIGSIHQRGRKLLVVVLGSPDAADRYRDATGLLEYGLVHFDRLIEHPHVPTIDYEVRAGDTLSGLAQRFGVPLGAILEANGMDDPHTLRVGQVVAIPQ